jgi:uncharacterized protein YutE (UPF0331/DUF86 family)
MAEQMARWAGLRNVLVHLYLAVDHEIRYDILKQDLGQLDRYARQMARAVDSELACSGIARSAGVRRRECD